jgi:hypothetical protein
MGQAGECSMLAWAPIVFAAGGMGLAQVRPENRVDWEGIAPRPCRCLIRRHVYSMVNMFAAFAVALLLGGMVFFAAVMAPLVFTQLPAEQAGRFIRAVFPFYYLYVFATAAGGAIALAWNHPTVAIALAVIALVTVWLRQGLMQRINVLSDAARAGDGLARARFNRAHRLSVFVNAAQIIAAAWSLVQLT